MISLENALKSHYAHARRTFWKLLPAAKTQLATYFKSTEASILRSSRSGPGRLDEGPEIRISIELRPHLSRIRRSTLKLFKKLNALNKFKLPGSFKVRVMDAQQSFRIPQSGQSCNFSYGVHSLEIFMAKKEPSQKASHQENDKSCITPEKERLLHRSYPHQLPSVMKHSKTCKA